MIVYLVRHGEAVPPEADPARPLSARGRAEVEATAKKLLAESAQVSEIWHSGKLRAKQTAEIIARVLGVNKVIEQKGLKPDDDPSPVADLIRQTNDAQRFEPRNRSTQSALLIAGHLPFLPKLANLLDPKLKVKEMGTGEAVRVSLIRN